MAGHLDVLKLMKMFPGVTLPYSSEKDPTTYTLIHVDRHAQSQCKEIIQIPLQKDPVIDCYFKIEDCTSDRIRTSMTFIVSNDELYTNLKYKASLYYMKSDLDSSFTFLETLHLENITGDSNFYFSLPIKECGEKYCYLFLKIARIDQNLTHMQIETPKSEIMKDLSLLYKKQLFTDVKIICKDQEFLAHKVLLMARSSVFQAKFEHKMKDSQENEIKITDVEPEILEHMLTFIYTDTVEDLKEGQVEELLAAANKYALENLKLICMKEIAKSIKNVQEAFDVLAIAEHHNVLGFRDIVLDFAQNEAKKS